jgi:hypothetical protein
MVITLERKGRRSEPLEMKDARKLVWKVAFAWLVLFPLAQEDVRSQTIPSPGAVSFTQYNYFPVSFRKYRDTIFFRVVSVHNSRPNPSGPLVLQVWATIAPTSGKGTINGAKLAEVDLGTVPGQSGPYPGKKAFPEFQARANLPPSGSYNVLFVLLEWIEGQLVPIDWGNLQDGLIVTEPPRISVQPVSPTPPGSAMFHGQPVSFYVIASGGDLKFQWKKDGVDINPDRYLGGDAWKVVSGVTRSELSFKAGSGQGINSGTLSDAGIYSVVITNDWGSVTSSGAVLSLITPLRITGRFFPTEVAAGRVSEFRVTAEGYGLMRYQWFKDGMAIPDAVNSRLTLSPVRWTDAGRYKVVVSDEVGSLTSLESVLTVIGPPSIIKQPQPVSVLAGQSATFSVSAEGPVGWHTHYRWVKRNSLTDRVTEIAQDREKTDNGNGTASSLTLTAVNAAHAGLYSVEVSTNWGSVISEEVLLTVSEPGSPLISVQPSVTTAVEGQTVSLSIVASGAAPLSYQWRKDAVAIPGATSSTLTLVGVSASNSGIYSVIVANGKGSVTSSEARLTVESISLIGNVSIRTNLDSFQSLIMGLTISGSPKSVLVRAVGPGLRGFGVDNAMPDPVLSVFWDGFRTATSDNWDDEARLAKAAGAVGAFPLAKGSKDAAILTSFSGGRTAHVQGAYGGGVLVEAYDTELSQISARLANVSARSRAGFGSNTLIAGFSIVGTVPKRILIRAVGPTLRSFGVTDALMDPKLEVYKGNVLWAKNDNWNWREPLGFTFRSVGAFPLPIDSLDAAIDMTLSPGGYTVHVSPASGLPGEALIEIYEVP